MPPQANRKSKNDRYAEAERRKIQVAKAWAEKNLPGFDDDDYRNILRESEPGCTSSTRLTWRGRIAVLKRFEELGWVPAPARKSRPAPKVKTRRLADDPQSKMIRAIWIELHILGDVRDPSEKALNGYVHRMTRVSDLSWLNDHQAETLIEALKDWRGRVTFRLFGEWFRREYSADVPELLAEHIRKQLNTLRIGEVPPAEALGRIGGAAWGLLKLYKEWEGASYG